jgi:hypothetical protein
MKIDLKEVSTMGTWWIGQVANQLQVYAWIMDHFKDPKVQAVIDHEGSREGDGSGDYRDKLEAVRDAAGGAYIDSSGLHHESVKAISDFILILAEREKSVRAALKKEKIAQLQKEIEALERP